MDDRELYTQRIEMLDAVLEHLATLDKDAPLPPLKEILQGAAVILGKKIELKVEQANLRREEE